MEPVQAERRGDERFPLHLPVVVKPMQADFEEESSLTQDLSACGAFFYLNSKLPEGTPVEFILTLPAEITLAQSIRVRCKGKVVRVVEGNGGKTGIATAIEQYDFLPVFDCSFS